ncbi:MAG TPA: Fur family transcriptional regulator [Anaerolineales bacterium]|nr:Fur family transcriptional regulator [Anaerolineales bacterium]
MQNVFTSTENDSHQWLVCLQENGYRLTEPRRAVVAAIASSQQALNPFDVFEKARSNYPRLGLVTVYRTLEKLEELGLIQRVHQPSGCQAFVTAFSGHQHLLICQRCGRVEFFDGDVEKMDGLMHVVAQNSGYQLQSHWLQLFGVCGNCQQRASRDAN